LDPLLLPSYGIGGVQFAISRVPVYTAISSFLSSCSQRFGVGVVFNSRQPFSFFKNFPSKIDSGDLHFFFKKSAFLLAEISGKYIFARTEKKAQT